MPPAARVGDMHTCPLVNPGPVPHVGGPILPPGAVTVLVGGVPAARVGDMCTCVGPPDVIVKGSFTVLIGGQPAARMGDNTAHGGVIVLGCPTVMIGESGSGGAGGPGAGGGGGGAAAVAAGAAGSGADEPSSNASVESAQGTVSDADQGAGGGNATPTRTGFATQDEAGKAALDEANPQSIEANKEYGGQVYRDTDGTYGYSAPVQGTDAGANPADSPAPEGTTVVGDYHTHGDYSYKDADGKAVRTDPAHDTYNSDNFSSTDRRGIAADGANTPGYKGYLGTPSGTYKTYDAASGEEGTL